MDNVFATLNAINVNGHTEKKNNLTYLSWAWAWAEVKKAYPDAKYTVYESPQGWLYWTDGRTCWVKTGVTIDGLEHIEYLPVMDYRNQSISADSVTSTDVNKAVQRSLTKACARHGLGLYIYAGEDLPEGEAPQQPSAATDPRTEAAAKKLAARSLAQRAVNAYCQATGNDPKDIWTNIAGDIGKASKDFTVADWKTAQETAERMLNANH